MKVSKLNPFVILPGEFWADRRHLWENITDYIELARMTGSNEIIVLVGDYGCGTTHTLKYLKEFLTKKGAFVSYITTPVRADMSSLFQNFMESVGTEKKKEILSDFIEDNVSQDALDREKVSPQQIEQAVLNLISGKKLSFRHARILEELGMPEDLPTPLEVWGRVLSDVATEEMPAFIFMDEFDAGLLDQLSSTSLLYGLRRLYDETLSGLCLVIALKGEPKDVVAKLGEALYSRMSLQPIYLPPLTKEDAVEFVKDVLKHKYAEKQRFAFTEEAIKNLAELACPCSPRRLLRICSVIFEEALRQKISMPVDKDFVFTMVTKFGEISFKVPEKIAVPKILVPPTPLVPVRKPGKRGPIIWSSAIDALIVEDFFKLPNRRVTADVVRALVDKGLPAAKKQAEIVIALRRKLKQHKLIGTKTPHGWTFWTE